MLALLEKSRDRTAPREGDDRHDMAVFNYDGPTEMFPVKLCGKLRRLGKLVYEDNEICRRNGFMFSPITKVIFPSKTM